MKKFIIIVLTFLITVFTCVLCTSFCLKEIVVNTLSKDIVKKEITSNVTRAIEELYEDVSYETLETIETNIGNSDKVTEITEKYFDNIVNSIINDDNESVPDTKEEILELINENQDILEENEITITDDQKEMLVDKLANDGKIEKVYQNVVTSVRKNLSSSEIKLVSLYDKMITNTFRWIISSIIIILILLIALIKKTYYRWTYNFGVSLALSGIILSLALPLVVDTVSIDLTEKLIGKASSINVNAIINCGYICFGLCAISIITYIIGNKITRYNDKKYD